MFHTNTHSHWLISSLRVLCSEFGTVQVPYQRKRKMQIEKAQLKLSFKVDLRDEWHWNSKQLFVWLTADFDNGKVKSSISLWDRIVLTQEASKFKVTAADTKYAFWDNNGALKNTVVRFTLHWDVHPWVGIIHRFAISEDADAFTLKLPKKYTSVHN